MSKSKRIQVDIMNVIDIEATCWGTEDIKPDENLTTIVEPVSDIIEIGITQIDIKKRERVYKESILVKPTNSEISEYCTNLTGWKKEDFNSAMTFKQACNYLQDKFLSKRRTWGSWGEYDRKQFIRQVERERIFLEKRKFWDISFPFSDRFINIKNLFAIKFGLEKEIGMEKAFDYLVETEGIDIKLEGNIHKGIDDSWNIANLFLVIVGREVNTNKTTNN